MFAARVPNIFAKTEYSFHRCQSCGSITSTCSPKPGGSVPADPGIASPAKP
jgi:hypothetical protein